MLWQIHLETSSGLSSSERTVYKPWSNILLRDYNTCVIFNHQRPALIEVFLCSCSLFIIIVLLMHNVWQINFSSLDTFGRVLMFDRIFQMHINYMADPISFNLHNPMYMILAQCKSMFFFQEDLRYLTII